MKRTTPSTVLCAALILAVSSGYASASSGPLLELEKDDAVRAHVRFLAAPALNGRGPMSEGSIRARRYIVRHFRDAGLVPWGDAGDLVQPIPFGRNIVGVLPGTDPELAREIVLVSAHYDHMGDGNLGAADNASGVGILLELVREFSRMPRTNKRTLCFAAFDCEELAAWGAVSFTRRTDFDPKRIATVVNMDMVGQKAFDCMESTLFMGRTHTFPPLNAATLQAAQHAGMQLLPYHTLLVGPRGDHIAFTSLGVPALFFSTGPFSDYHTRRDTVDRLDWDLLRQSRTVIAASVRQLASGVRLDAGPPEALGSKDDLLAIRAVLAAHSGQPDTDAQKIRAVTDSIDAMLSAEPYSATEARQLIPQTLLALGPKINVVFGWSDWKMNPEDAERTVDSQVWQLLFFEMHEADIMAHYRAFAGDFFDHARPAPDPDPLSRLLGTTIVPLRDDEIAVVDLGNGQYHLGVVLPKVTFRNEHKNQRLLRLLALADTHFSAGWQVYTCRGSQDDLIDYCLMQSLKDPSAAHKNVWVRVLERVAPSRPKSATIEDALGRRLEETGCADLQE
ncbi:MAG: M28 family peptidase, partial [Candidatus Hydrogenedentales bacterium]